MTQPETWAFDTVTTVYLGLVPAPVSTDGPNVDPPEEVGCPWTASQFAEDAPRPFNPTTGWVVAAGEPDPEHASRIVPAHTGRSKNSSVARVVKARSALGALMAPILPRMRIDSKNAVPITARDLAGHFLRV